MNLAIDIGNTSTKLGLFEGEVLKQVLIGDAALDEIFSSHPVEFVIVSKSGLGGAIESNLSRRKIQPLVVSSKLTLPIEILYKTPETLGSDRIAGSTAASHLFPDQAVLKIDFGTCITFDFVNEKRQYLGGAISPGLSMRFKAMHDYTAHLPMVTATQPTSVELIGTDTSTSLVSGAVNGIKCEVEGIIKEYEKRSEKLRVVITGGDAPLFATLLKSEIFARPNLVLEGMNRILNYNL